MRMRTYVLVKMVYVEFSSMHCGISRRISALVLAGAPMNFSTRNAKFEMVRIFHGSRNLIDSARLVSERLSDR